MEQEEKQIYQKKQELYKGWFINSGQCFGGLKISKCHICSSDCINPLSASKTISFDVNNEGVHTNIKYESGGVCNNCVSFIIHFNS